MLTNPQDVVLMKSIHTGVRAVDCSRSMHRELLGRGQRIGLHRVERLILENGIRTLHMRHFKATTHSRHSMSVADDRLHAALCAAGYNLRWLLRMIIKKGVAFLWPVYLTLRGVTGMPKKWGEFVAQVTKLASGPSKLTALAH